VIELLTDPLVAAQRVLFVLTLLVQIVALRRAWTCRSRFEPTDAARTTWSFITLFLAVRVLAELRLSTLYFDLVPEVIQASELARTIYVVVLRYLYTASDILLVIALVGVVRAYRSLGLHFRTERSDHALMMLVMAFPLVVWLLRHRMTNFLGGQDPTIVVYRLVAVTVTTVVVILCIVIWRYVRQMGGGVLARVWRAVVVAGLARAGSFVTLAIVSTWSLAWANLAEQVLLLAFAIAWIAAAGRQHAILDYVRANRAERRSEPTARPLP
jgi:hypothetical protein